MVQFIREQTRHYAADQTSAIRQAQRAQNVGEWGSAIKNITKFSTDVMSGLESKALEADEQMINTEAVSRLENDLLQWNTDNIVNGVDTSTEEYTKQLYAKRDEMFNPYIEQMQSEKGRAFLQKQGLDTAERIRRSNIGTIAQNRKKAQAQQAFIDTANNVGKDAREYGKLGDWAKFKEATEADRKALSDYAKSKLGENANQANYAMDMQNLKNFILGQAETDPEEVVKVFGTKEDYQEIKRDEQKEKMSKPEAKGADEFADDVTDWQYRKEGIEEYAAQKKLDYLPAEAVKQATDSFVRSKKEEKQELEQEMKGVAKDSKHYKALDKKRDEIQEQIDDPQKYVVEAMTDDIRKAVVPIAKEQIGRNKLAEKQLQKEAEIYTYRAVLNPDTSVSFPAQMALSLGKEQTEEMYQMSIPDEDIRKAYDAYAQTKVDTLTREYATIEGTDAMIDAYRKVLEHDPADQLGAIKEVFDGFVALHNAPVTQKQIDNYQNAMYAALQDGAFADLMRSFTSLQDIYTPDTDWFQNALGRVNTSMVGDKTTPEGIKLANMGLTSKAVMAQDVDTVEKYFRNKVVDITNNTGGMLALAASQQDPAARRALGQQAVDYYTSEKRKTFDYAMQNFGIDMGALRDAYKSGREVITNVGGVTVRYLGDNPSTGLPNFEPYINEAETKRAIDRILDAGKILMSL